jgi:hypothetical protein
MKLNANISSGNRLFIQVYPTLAFLNKSCMCYVVYNGPDISIRGCWIDKNEIIAIYRYC